MSGQRFTEIAFGSTPVEVQLSRLAAPADVTDLLKARSALCFLNLAYLSTELLTLADDLDPHTCCNLQFWATFARGTNVAVAVAAVRSVSVELALVAQPSTTTGCDPVKRFSSASELLADHVFRLWVGLREHDTIGAMIDHLPTMGPAFQERLLPWESPLPQTSSWLEATARCPQLAKFPSRESIGFVRQLWGRMAAEFDAKTLFGAADREIALAVRDRGDRSRTRPGAYPQAGPDAYPWTPADAVPLVADHVHDRVTALSPNGQDAAPSSWSLRIGHPLACTQGRLPADGPASSSSFRLCGKLLEDLPASQLRLLEALWDREAGRPRLEVPFDEVEFAVWRGAAPSKNALYKCMGRVNDRLGAAGLAAVLETGNAHMWLRLPPATL